MSPCLKSIDSYMSGLRGNGLVGYARKLLIAKGIKPWIIMEAIDDHGIVGWFKRIYYSYILSQIDPYISGILSIGTNTSEWLARRGFDSSRIYLFHIFCLALRKSIFHKI